MNNYVLFSPIGNTDPIRDGYDGALLHIVRHYRPSVCYLYFTYEMQQNKDKVQKALNHLLSFMNHKTEIFIKCSDIQTAHDFDVFHNEFEPILLEINEKYPDLSIIVNISSGTPQMKSALCLECVSSHLSLLPVQVSSPAKGSNAGKDFGGDTKNNYDDLTENNEYICPNRCVEPKLLSFKKTAVKRYIIGLIEHYEYSAAHEIISANSNLFSEQAQSLIKYAKLRQNQNSEYLKINQWHSKYNIVKYLDAQKACDYYCILNNKAQTGEFSYFVLALKPLFEYIAKYYAGNFSQEEASEQLNKFYLETEKRKYKPFKKNEYNMKEYVQILKMKNKDEETIAAFEKLLNYAQSRNDLAHKLLRKDDINVKEALKLLKFIIKRVFANRVNDNSFELYNTINKEICELL